MDFTYLQEHLGELVSYMREHNYAESYISRYRITISQIVSHAAEQSWESYNDVYVWYQSQQYKDCRLREIRAILGKLERFHLYSAYPDGKSSMSSFWDKKASYYRLSSEYRGLVDYYCQAERQRGLKETTVYSGSHKTASFLLALQNKGEDSLKTVTEASVLSCFFDGEKQIRGATCSKAAIAFFKVCMPLNQMACQRMISFIPELRVARKNIAYLSDEECSKIRAVLDDHENGLWYKDRAIGMLLLYTGIRGGDIANLLLTAIDWKDDKIHFVQQKTQRPHELPLTAIVGNAIYDYCLYERPRVDNPRLFLSCDAPHGALTSDGIGVAVMRIMEKADIRQSSGARKGTHIFRHRVATALLGNGVPRPVISSTLGQDAPFSLDPYLYADMVHLKDNALDVEPYAVLEGVFANA